MYSTYAGLTGNKLQPLPPGIYGYTVYIYIGNLMFFCWVGTCKKTENIRWK